MVSISLKVRLLLLEDATKLIFNMESLGVWSELHGDGGVDNHGFEDELVMCDLVPIVSQVLHLLNDLLAHWKRVMKPGRVVGVQDPDLEDVGLSVVLLADVNILAADVVDEFGSLL